MRHHELRRSLSLIALQLALFMAPVVIVYLLVWDQFGSIAGLVQSFQLPPWAGRVLLVLYRVTVLVIFLETFRRFYDEALTMTNKRVIHSKGLLSFNLRRVSIAYRDVRDIRIEQSLMGRLFDYGTVYLGTASIQDHEIAFTGASDPFDIARQIEARCAKVRGKSGIDALMQKELDAKAQGSAAAGEPVSRRGFSSGASERSAARTRQAHLRQNA